MAKPSSPALQSSNALAAGLVRCIPFTEGEGQTLADLSSTGANLTTWQNGGASPLTWGTDATQGGFLSFSGNGQDAIGPDTGLPIGSAARTFAFLFRTSNRGGVPYQQWFASYGQASGDKVCVVGLANQGRAGDTYEALYTTTFNHGVGGLADLVDGAWHTSVVAITAAGVVTQYVDGSAIPISTDPDQGSAASFPGYALATASAGRLLLGQLGNDSAYFRGDLAGVWVWDRALSADEVSRLQADPWQMVRPPAAPTPPTKVALSGPAVGYVGNPATLTATLDTPATSPVTVALVSSSAGDTLSASATITIGATSATFSLTPTSAGSRTITATSAGLTAGTLAYTANARTLSVSPGTITPGASSVVTFTGGGTRWLTTAPTFAGSGLTIGPVAVASATATVTASTGSYTLSDPTTGAAAILVAASTFPYLGVADLDATGLTTARARAYGRDGATLVDWSTAPVFEVGSGRYRVVLDLPRVPLVVECDDGVGGPAATDDVTPYAVADMPATTDIGAAVATALAAVLTPSRLAVLDGDPAGSSTPWANFFRDEADPAIPAAAIAAFVAAAVSQFVEAMVAAAVPAFVAALAGATVGDLGSKTGFALSPSGLDSVIVEPGVNARQALAPILAGVAGTVTGADSPNVVIKDPVNGVVRISSVTDDDGNRAVTLNLPS